MTNSPVTSIDAQRFERTKKQKQNLKGTMQANPNQQFLSRRQFLRSSTLAAAAAVVAAPAMLRAQSNSPLKAVIICVGGRGSGAGRDFTDALKIAGVEGKIVDVADTFPEAAKKAGQTFEVPDDNCFSGFDAYQKA